VSFETGTAAIRGWSADFYFQLYSGPVPQNNQNQQADQTGNPASQSNQSDATQPLASGRFREGEHVVEQRSVPARERPAARHLLAPAVRVGAGVRDVTSSGSLEIAQSAAARNVSTPQGVSGARSRPHIGASTSDASPSADAGRPSHRLVR
jgi:hypothetical protein